MYSYYSRCALEIANRLHGMALYVQLRQATCIYLECKPSDSSREISKSLYYESQVY